jgi:hypothetical protein
MTRFDLGGCNPNVDRSDSRYGVYFFKSQWGGELKKFYNGETVLSRLGYEFQERILGNVWRIGHPLYGRTRNLLRSG